MKKLAIIGAGNLGKAIAFGIVQKGVLTKEQVVLTRKSTSPDPELVAQGFEVLNDNVKAVQGADTIIFCVLPKQLAEVLEQLAPHLSEEQVVVSVVTGFSLEQIRSSLIKEHLVVRAMPNTAIAIGHAMTCISTSDVTNGNLTGVQKIFQALGEVLIIEEHMMKAATVLGASGIAFFMRYLRAATQGGIEMGFHPAEAQKIAVQTAKGAAGLIIENGNHPEIEIDKVTTPQGCTIAGLNEMEHQGLSSALIKGLLTSYEKINSIQS